jgi:hypothetical protein
MIVWARYEPAAARATAVEMVLLEGSWPVSQADRRQLRSLDDEIDARHAWIDDEAASRAEQIATADTASWDTAFAWLNIVKLRYHLLKLLRVVAFFRELRSLGVGERVELHLARGCDEPYAEVFAELCRQARAVLQIHWSESASQSAPRVSLRAHAIERARRSLAGVLANRWSPGEREPRVILCGNPRILEPICAELLARGLRPAWLFEKFALRTWLKWRGRHVAQLVVGGTRPAAERLSLELPNDVSIAEELPAPQVPLPAAAWTGWLAAQTRQLLPTQAGMVANIERLFARQRPTHVVVDQDASPLARALVAAARRWGARSVVVQHGVPYVRYGYAPLVADCLCAWGETSREQLAGWGVDRRRMRVTGFPPHDALMPKLAAVAARGPSKAGEQVLLLATLAPRDERPDLARYHQTTATFARMLRRVTRVLAEAGIARLIVKLHPRDSTSHVVRRLMSHDTNLEVRFVEQGDLATLLADVTCVLSCASSAGVEATLAGVPVIQLMPEGSADMIDDRAWGLLGTARSDRELHELLAEARADTGHRIPGRQVFGPHPASAAVVDVLLEEPGERIDERASHASLVLAAPCEEVAS